MNGKIKYKSVSIVRWPIYSVIFLLAVNLIVVALVLHVDVALDQISSSISGRASIWQTINGQLNYIINNSSTPQLSADVASSLQKGLSEGLENDKRIIASTTRLTNRPIIAFWIRHYGTDEEATAINNENINPTVQAFVHSMIVAPTSVVRTAFSALDTSMGILVRSNRVLGPLERQLAAIHGLQARTIRLGSGLIQLFGVLALINILVLWRFIIRPRLQAADEVGDALAASEAELRLVLNNLPAAVASFDRYDRHMTANRSYRRAFAKGDEEDLSDLTFEDIVPPAVRPMIGAKFDEASITDIAFDLVLPYESGPRHVNVKCVKYRGEERLHRSYVLIVDLEDRYQAEQLVRDSEERYRSLVRSAAEAVFVIDTVMDRVVELNPAAVTMFAQMFRISEHDLATRSALESFPAKDLGERKLQDLFDRALAGELVTVEWVIDDETAAVQTWLELRFVRMTPIVARRLRVIAIDITKRKRAERELKRSEERLRTTLNSIGDAVITTNRDNHVSSMNPLAEEITGWSIDQARGRPLEKIFDVTDEDANPVQLYPQHVSASRVLEPGHDPVLRSRVGSPIAISYTAAPIRSDDGESHGLVLVFKDVTLERALAGKRHQDEKLRTIGQLATGIAHDFNNILAAISGSAQVLLKDAMESCRTRVVDISI